VGAAGLAVFVLLVAVVHVVLCSREVGAGLSTLATRLACMLVVWVLSDM
jgi:hypothetical protein